MFKRKHYMRILELYRIQKDKPDELALMVELSKVVADANDMTYEQYLELDNAEATRLFQDVLDKVSKGAQQVPPVSGTP